MKWDGKWIAVAIDSNLFNGYYRKDHKIRKAFADGLSVMTVEWGDTAQLSADPKKSAVAGKVGYFVLPGTDEIWNYKSGEWEKANPPHKEITDKMGREKQLAIYRSSMGLAAK